MLCCSAVSTNAQTPGTVSVTGDLVNSTPTATATTSTWQNVGSWNQGLPCWAPGDPGYCGPQPYFNQGVFNFSWGLTDVYQTVNIGSALANSGTGLRVTGYNFGFMAKNGNGWDNGQTDYLSAYVRFTGPGGQTLQDYYYDLNYKFDWTQFSFSKNFDTPYSLNKISTATYGFVGGDSNYWAGPYGPEIYNINFSLKYDVDPCSTNPLSSPSCAGFADAMKKITDTAVVAVETTPVQATTVTASTTTAPSTTTTTTAPTVDSQPATTASVVAVAPATTTSQTRSVAPLSTASVLSNIRNIEQQLQNTVNSTVQTSIQTSIEAGQAQAQQDASRGQQAGAESLQSQTQSPSQGSGSPTAPGSAASGSGLSATGPLFTFGFSMPGVTSAFSSPLSSSRITDSSVGNNDTAVQDSPMASLTRPGDPTQAARTGNRDIAASEPVQESGPTVRNTAPPAQLAGGADFAAMSRATDITSYANIRLTDAAFYQPREIYRGQRVVDNARVLRGLGSDRLHQQMVEQQYQGK